MSSAGFPGRSIPDDNALLILDLDHTILSINSFPRWAFYMLAGKFTGIGMKERLALSCTTAIALLRRKFLHERHGITRRRLQRLWMQTLCKDAKQQALHYFISQLGRFVRPALAPLLDEVARGEFNAILATAAAAEYAAPLGKMLGFTHIITSPSHEEEFDILQNAYARKRDDVLACIAAQGWQEKKRIVFTDHEDDLPLMRESAVVFWFGNQDRMEAVRAQAAGVEIIPALHMSSGQISAGIARVSAGVLQA